MNPIIIFAIALYLLPAVIAAFRLKRNFAAILILNLILGWTFFGWVFALVWSCMSDPYRPSEA